jgi:RimJ/RimL family protein N-acetyltransferase
VRPARSRAVLNVLTTARLALDRFAPVDAPFVLALLNDPGWLRYIGDRGVRTDDAAREYIVHGPMAMYAREGFGLWKVSLRQTREPIGMAGLIKRPALDDVDLGFAFLPAWRGQGYAREAARGCIGYARDTLKLARLVAIVSPDNADSLRLLAALGFAHERELEMKPGDRVELHGLAR